MTPSRYMSLFRVHICRVLFPLAAAWLVLLLFAEAIGNLQTLNPFLEGTMPHSLFEMMVVWIPALLIFALAASLLYWFPEFLRLPESISLTRTATRIAISGPVLFLTITIGVVALNYLFYDPAADPQGQFHIWVWGGGLLYASALTPFATILWVWRVARRRTEAA